MVWRGGGPDAVTVALGVQQAVTVVCSAYNVRAFLGYRSPRPRRRLGALVLALVNAAFLTDALALGLLPLLTAGASHGAGPGARLAVGTLAMAAAATITLLVARQRRPRGRPR